MADNIEAPMTPPTPPQAEINAMEGSSLAQTGVQTIPNVPTGASGITADSDVVKQEMAKFPGLSVEAAIGNVEMRKSQDQDKYLQQLQDIDKKQEEEKKTTITETEKQPVTSKETLSIQADVPSASSDLANQIKQISDDNQLLIQKQISAIDSYTASLDERFQGQIDRVKEAYAARKQAQDQINKAIIGGMTRRGSQSGRARYASDLQDSIITGEESNGVSRMAELDRQEQQLISEIQYAQEDKNWEMFNEKFSLLIQGQKAKEDTLKDLNALAIQEEDRAFKRLEKQRAVELWDREDETYAMEKANTELSNYLSAGMNYEDLDQDKIAELEQMTGLPEGGIERMMGNMKAAQEAEAANNDFEKNLKIVDMLKDLPAGLQVNIGGQTYMGLKTETPNYASYTVTDANGNTTTNFYDKNVGPQGETFSIQTEYAKPNVFASLASGIIDKESPDYQLAESVFGGTFTLDNIADKDQKQNVAVIMGQMAEKAKTNYENTGNKMYAIQSTAVYDKTLSSIEKESLAGKMGIVNELDKLKQEFNNVDFAGPIAGMLRDSGINAYDDVKKIINTRLTQITPTIARDVFGEVGVLTDSDLERYIGTLPNLKTTKEQTEALMTIITEKLEGQIDNTVDSHIIGKTDISQFAPAYQQIKTKISNMLGTEPPRMLAGSEDEILDQNPADGNILLSIGDYLTSVGVEASDQNIIDEYNMLTPEKLNELRTNLLNVTGDGKKDGLNLSKPTSGMSFSWVGGDTKQASNNTQASTGSIVSTLNNKIPAGTKYPSSSNEGQCGYWSRKIVDYPSGTGNSLQEKKNFIDKKGIKPKEWKEQGVRVGDVLITNESQKYGHVAVVAAVNNDGTVTLAESNYVPYTVTYDRKLAINSNKIIGAVRGKLKI